MAAHSFVRLYPRSYIAAYPVKHVPLRFAPVSLQTPPKSSMGDGVLRHACRYVKPFECPASPVPTSQNERYDVIMEVWYSSKELFDAFQGQSSPGSTGIMMQDERNLSHRGCIVMFLSHGSQSKRRPWMVQTGLEFPQTQVISCSP